MVLSIGHCPSVVDALLNHSLHQKTVKHEKTREAGRFSKKCFFFYFAQIQQFNRFNFQIHNTENVYS